MLIIARIAFVGLALIYRFILRDSFHRFGRDAVESDGLKYFVNRGKSKLNGAVVDSDVIFEVQELPVFRITQESCCTRLLKILRLTIELQTGNEELDKRFYIMSDHRGFLNYLKNHKVLQKKIFQTSKGVGWTQMTSDGAGHLIFHFTNEASPSHVEALKPIMNEMFQLKLVSEADPYFWRYILLEVVVFTIAAYAAGAYLSFIGDTGTSLLKPYSLVFSGFVCGLALFIAMIFLSALFLRGSSRLPLLFVDFGVVLIISFVIAGPQLILDMNRWLDKSPPQFTEAVIVDNYYRSSGGGTRRNNLYYVNVVYRENPFDLPETLTLSGWDYGKFKKGQGVRFTIHEGFFGAKYIADREIIKAPFEVPIIEGETPPGL